MLVFFFCSFEFNNINEKALDAPAGPRVLPSYFVKKIK